MVPAFSHALMTVLSEYSHCEYHSKQTTEIFPFFFEEDTCERSSFIYTPVIYASYNKPTRSLYLINAFILPLICLSGQPTMSGAAI